MKKLSGDLLNYLNQEEEEIPFPVITEEIQNEINSLPISNELIQYLNGEEDEMEMHNTRKRFRKS